MLFIELLCESTKGLFVLENVLKSIDSIFSKDVLESLSHDSTNFTYDKIPADDNRALEEDRLNSAMKEGFLWFFHLDGSSQIRVILRLLRLGGGGLVFSAYRLIGKILWEKDPRNTEVESLHGEKDGDWEEDVSKASSLEFFGKTHVFEVKSYDSASVRDFAIRKQKQLSRREEELLKYKQLRGLLEEDEKKGGKSEEAVDYLQILPLWLNRRIMSYIDDKTLSGFKKVGKYWSKMIDESINEKSGRKAINAKINKIIGIKADKDEKKREENGGEEELEVIKELGAKDLIKAKKENEKALAKQAAQYKSIFSKKYTIKSLDATYHPERCGASDDTVGIIACSTPNNLIHFYSLKTGARYDFLIFGVESVVTCLSLHDNKTHIFIGCGDGTVICKDFRTNRTNSTIKAHSKAVLSISTTPSNFLSSSKDNTIKYFQLWSGICLLCIDLNPELNVSSVLLRNDKNYLAAIGTTEGFVILVNVEAKHAVPKVKLHIDEIQQLAHDGDFLITGSAGGKIRIWNMNHIQGGRPNLRPYYDINVQNPVTALKFYDNQILCGCGNGTVKIISLATGGISKTLKISSQTAITGVDVTEDKPFMKLIIWHEEGIEIRTFSLQKQSTKKIQRANWKSKQKAPKEWKKQRKFEKIQDEQMRRAIWETIETVPKVRKRRTYDGSKMALKDRICTISGLRTQYSKHWQFETDVFSEAFNSSPSRPGSFIMSTFPRYNTPK